MGQNYQQPPTSSAIAAGITTPHQQSLLWESPCRKRLEYTASLRVPKSVVSIAYCFYFVLFYLRCRGSFQKWQWMGHDVDSLTQQAGFHSVKKKKKPKDMLCRQHCSCFRVFVMVGTFLNDSSSISLRLPCFSFTLLSRHTVYLP